MDSCDYFNKYNHNIEDSQQKPIILEESMSYIVEYSIENDKNSDKSINKSNDKPSSVVIEHEYEVSK